MDRPRYRRRDPQRTGPLRNAGGAWKGGEPSYDPWDPDDDDDPASRGVHAASHVIEEQIRRGYEMAEGLGPGPRAGHRHQGGRQRPAGYYDDEDYDRYPEEPWSRYGDGHWHGHRHRPGDGHHLLSLPMRQLERLAREILNQAASARPDPFRLARLIFQLQIEALSELVGAGLGWGSRPRPYPGDDCWDHEPEPEPGEEPWWKWPAAPSAPTEIHSTVPIPVYVWSRGRTEIDLDLRPGSQDLDLRVERLRPVDSQPIPVHVHTETHTDPEPHTHTYVHGLLPEAEFISVHGLTLLGVRVPPGQPAGRYRSVVRSRTGGEPLGTLTVEVEGIPTVLPPVIATEEPAKPPKPPAKKAPAKPRPRAGKP